jgi:hypothetical protein
LDPSRNRVQVNLQREGASVEEPEVLGVGVGLEKAAFFLEEERHPFPLLGVAVQAEGALGGGGEKPVVLLGVQEVVPEGVPLRGVFQVHEEPVLLEPLVQKGEDEPSRQV